MYLIALTTACADSARAIFAAPPPEPLPPPNSADFFSFPEGIEIVVPPEVPVRVIFLALFKACSKSSWDEFLSKSIPSILTLSKIIVPPSSNSKELSLNNFSINLGIRGALFCNSAGVKPSFIFTSILNL